MSESGIGCQPHDRMEHESDRVSAGWGYLSELAEVNPRSPSPTVGETVSFVAMADVSESGVVDNIELREASSGYTPFAVGDVLVAKITPCFENGKGAHVRGLPTRCGLGSTEFHVLRPRSTTSDRYLYHLTRTSRFRLQGEGLMSGSAGQRRVPTEFFGRYAVRMPPLEEQRRIAGILDTIDDTIEATERVIEKHKRVRRGLASDLLEGRSTSAARDWRRHRLIELVASSVDGPFGSALKTEHYVPSAGVRLVRLANLGDGVYVDGDDAFIEEGYAHVLRRHEVRAGDVLVASLGDDNHRPGRACLYPEVFPPGIVKADCFRIRPSRSVDSRFLMEILNSRGASSQIRRLAQGVTRDRVNLSQLRRIILEIPPLEEQRRIAAILDTIDGTIRANEGRLDKLRQLRSGLAADLLSGRVRTVAA